MRRACWRVNLCVFKCAAECDALPPQMRFSKFVMRCQLDFSQLITGMHMGCHCEFCSLSYALARANFFNLARHARFALRALARSLSICALQMWITCLLSL